ncbi:DUF2268 domain-containing putative Zn-dependent protease [Clostridium lundense]|uniref:DUF2268 domain-containing putative Zn-dependent protease n=1 Tax=Clostridium lundense TaxID=319475 RepID=UPI00310149C5
MSKMTGNYYGDGIAPVGMPYCAKYTCGYHLIKHYLKKTSKTLHKKTKCNLSCTLFSSKLSFYCLSFSIKFIH